MSLLFGLATLLAAYMIPEEVTPEQAARRVRLHLLVHDVDAAVNEGRLWLERYPEDRALQFAYLEALCSRGEEMEAYAFYSKILTEVKDQTHERLLSEWLSWGVLGKGEGSSVLSIRLYSLLGAAFTGDAKAIPILLRELRGTNAFLRSIAVKLSAQYGDDSLQKELLRLLQEEKMWFVRLDVIQAVGTLRIHKAKDILSNTIADPKTSAEERQASILALMHMYDSIPESELLQLLHSNRAGLRYLACEIIGYFDLKDRIRHVVPLLQDASPDVRIAAMNVLGTLRVTEIAGTPTIAYLQKNLNSEQAEVSITAAWLAILLGHKEGQNVMQRHLQQSDLQVQRLACAALAATGVAGAELVQQELQRAQDPYCRVNLARGLIVQRKDTRKCADVIFRELQNPDAVSWMWTQSGNPLFGRFAPNETRHIEQVPRYPQLVDDMTQLELLSILAVVKHPQAQEAIKTFLKKRDPHVASMAAMALLQEGDDETWGLIQQLLKDPDEEIRVQAALLLAGNGADASVIEVLMGAYPQADRDLKIQILEAIGHVGDEKVIPFLLEILKEPFQGLRMVAAAAIMQCLYH